MQSGEACDDGNATNTDGCTATCTLPRCGDGFLQVGEACDDANASNADGCTSVCQTARCGDGFVQVGEACDDGNATNTDGCSNTCQAARCGDSFVQTGEGCDDGNAVTESCGYGQTICTVCSSSCQPSAGATAYCGDGIRNGAEGCDDGNAVTEACAYGAASCTVCSATCTSGAGAVSRCGDGTVQSGEACDDGNATSTDACTVTCTLPRCGDGFVQSGESCDDGNASNADACTNTCQASRCGDGFVQSGETCDDGNATNTDDCTNTCQAARCGDSFVQSGEACDDGNVLTDSCGYGQTACSVCSSVCQLATGATSYCGDGTRNGTEGCDDGNTATEACVYGAASCTVCSSTCAQVSGAVSRCGDGTVQSGEACDDGNATNTDGCTSTCALPRCGDGFVHSGESCDDGNGSNADACTNSCQASRCGDGFLQSGEACDDGNATNTDGCTNTCQAARCGDSFVQSGEGCDDGNAVTESCGYGQTACSVCSSVCQLATGATSYCGDGTRNGAEGCDDGNTATEACAYGAAGCTVCAATCTLVAGLVSRCGDGLVQGSEECDDANLSDTDLCLSSCVRARCGDGFVQPGEQCDDANAVDADGCSNLCRSAYCGDGLVQTGEACDDGNRVNTDNCTNVCRVAGCGDGFIQGTEECDDGNVTTEVCPYGVASCAVCDSSCSLFGGSVSICGDGVINDGEECDRGSENTGTCPSGVDYCETCNGSCTVQLGEVHFCGDGVLDAGERCDDGNSISNDACDLDCVPNKAVCWGSIDTDSMPNLRRSSDAAVGSMRICALTDAGRIRCWGGVPRPAGTNDNQGNAVEPGGLPQATAITAAPGNGSSGSGDNFCYIDRAGRPGCFGSNPLLSEVPIMAPVIDVAANSERACAVTRAGGVECWPASDVPANLGLVRGVSMSSNATCVAQQDGGVRCWGSSTAPQTSPPIGIRNAVDVTVTDSFACVREWSSASGLLCWGNVPTLNYAGVVAKAEASGRDLAVIDPSGNAFTFGARVNSYRINYWAGLPVLSYSQVRLSQSAICLVRRSGELSCGSSDNNYMAADVSGMSMVPRNGSGEPSHVEVGSWGVACMYGSAVSPQCWGDSRYLRDQYSNLLGRDDDRLFDDLALGGGQGSAIQPNLPGSGARWGPFGARLLTNIFPNASLVSEAMWWDVDRGNNYQCQIRSPSMEVTCDDGANGMTPPVGAFRHISVGENGAVCGIRTSDLGVTCSGRIPAVTSGVPSGLRGVRAVTVGAQHACVLTAESTVQCWGVPGPWLSVPNVSSRVTSISAGDRHNCMTTELGQTVCWGDNEVGQTNVPAWLPNDATEVSSDAGVSCVVRTSDWCPYGRHFDGLECVQNERTCDVTNGTGNQSWGTGFRTIERGNGIMCASRIDETQWCWGDNSTGLIPGEPVGLLATPRNAAALRGFRKVAFGSTSACGLTATGQVKCWGSNSSGQLGTGTTLASPMPVSVSLPGFATDVSVASDFACAVLASGDVYCWGANNVLQLGSNGAGSLLPRMAAVSDAVSISAAGANACVLQVDGGVMCWGSAANYMLGGGATLLGSTLPASPILLSGQPLRSVSTISLDESAACAVSAGQAFCWGQSLVSARTYSGSRGDAARPTLISGSGGLSSISVGDDHACGTRTDGTVDCWGNNASGAQGRPWTTDRAATAGAMWHAGETSGVAAGELATCLLTRGGELKCVGSDARAELGNGVDSDANELTGVEKSWSNCAATSCDAANHVESGACLSDTRACALPNALTATQLWNAGTGRYGSCTASTCTPSYHVESGSCVSDVRSCMPLASNSATGSQTWAGSGYGPCIVTACLPTYHIEGSSCVSDTRTCSVLPSNATSGTQTWDVVSDSFGTCVATSCTATFHVESGACLSDTRECALPGAIGATQTWNGSGYSTCTAAACLSTYHFEAGVCVSDTRACGIPNGTGIQSYELGAWGACGVVRCNTGFHLEAAECVSDTRPCPSLPPNATAGTQAWAGSDYGSCTISACVADYVVSAGACLFAPNWNNILIERLGNGATTLTSTGAIVSLLEFTPDGVLVSTDSFPTSGANLLVDSGTTASQGFFGARNGVVVVAGYEAPIPRSALITATGINRVANVFNGDLTVANSTRLTFGPSTAVAASNLRSIVPLTASSGYIGGNNSGVTYYSYDSGTATTTLSSILPGNVRIVEVYDGQSYYSTGSAPVGIWKLGTGTPTAAASAILFFATSTSPYGFLLFDTNTDGTPDLAYVCDDGTAANSGGLKKYNFNGSSWTNTWTLRTAVAPATALASANANACNGLTGSYVSGTATLYFTEATITSNNRVMKVTDTGTQPTAATTIATAGVNYVFRGVDLKRF